MTEQLFLKELERLIEAPEGSLQCDQPLEGLAGWDSLAVLGVIAIADERFGRRVKPAELGNCRTVGDVARLLGATPG